MMRWAWLVALAAVSGCTPAATDSEPNGTRADQAVATRDALADSTSDALVQFSLLAALAADDYVGGPKLTEALKRGDFGIGTFDRLDGELILLDGEVFQALADGTVRRADLNGTTPFASVTFFAADGQIESLSAATLSDLDEQLDRKLSAHNSPYALRISGKFESLTLRSVPPQQPPFRPLVEVVRDEQVTWQHANVAGTLLGFRCPEWMGTINVSGYHWHFLSDDRQTGGHVLDCEFTDLALDFDECTSIVIELPKSETFQHTNLGGVSESDVERIERQRAHD
jgi:acetolactate decarboxylase